MIKQEKNLLLLLFFLSFSLTVNSTSLLKKKFSSSNPRNLINAQKHVTNGNNLVQIKEYKSMICLS